MRGKMRGLWEIVFSALCGLGCCVLVAVFFLDGARTEDWPVWLIYAGFLFTSLAAHMPADEGDPPLTDN